MRRKKTTKSGCCVCIRRQKEMKKELPVGLLAIQSDFAMRGKMVCNG
ncbi:MAG: hypothetical protein ACLTML_09640 [Blautia faecis]